MSSIYDKASLIIAPGARKAGKLLAIKPQGLEVDFSRAGEATEIDKDGVMRVVDANVSRFDHYSGGCPVILLEKQSTNLLTFSKDFSIADWTKTNATVTPNTDVSPFGEMTADTVTNSAGLIRSISESKSPTRGGLVSTYGS